MEKKFEKEVRVIKNVGDIFENDDDGKIFFSSEKIFRGQKVRLQWWINVAIIIASLSTLCMAVIEVLEYFEF